MNRGLESLRDSGGQLTAALNAGERFFVDRRIPRMRRAQFRSEDARSRNCILYREINADAADRRHRMGGVSDAEQAGKTPALQAVDLHRKEGNLLP
jgi:hypothetical protein